MSKKVYVELGKAIQTLYHYRQRYVTDDRENYAIYGAEWLLREEVPRADVQEVKHAHWQDDEGKFVKLDDNGCPVKSAWCSACNDWLTGSDEYSTRGYYCPNCGARMDEEVDNG